MTLSALKRRVISTRFIPLKFASPREERVRLNAQTPLLHFAHHSFSALRGRKYSPEQEKCAAAIAQDSVECDVGSTRPVNMRT